MAQQLAAPIAVRNSGRASTTRRFFLLDRYFYFFMSLLIAAVVAYGFGQTVNPYLIHAAPPRPLLLWFHGAVFSSWVVFYIFQSALVRTHNVKLHRTLGWFGAGLASAMTALGIATAIVMKRFDLMHALEPDAAAFLIISLWDITAFTVAFWLAMCWRRKPEYHRRLILVASCALSGAAFSRFPATIVNPTYAYVWMDGLILLGVVRDVIVMRRIHPIYVRMLVLFVPVQIFVMHTYLHASPWWMRISHAILGV